MKTALCAIAKDENQYINDWVNYHLALGFDNIYVYDNNDPETPFVGNFISDKERVSIIDWHNSPDHCTNQVEAYNNFIDNYSQQYDWCAFLDIDEFVHISDNRSLKQFLADAPTDGNIVLNWRVYGDDDIIEGDESVPVYERFLTPKFTAMYCVYKSIVNFKQHNDYRAVSPHIFSPDLGVPPLAYDCNFNQARLSYNAMSGSYNDIMRLPCYIAHYQTKSLSEFIKYKKNRGNQYDLDWNYYFSINDRTAEKEAYIEAFNNK